MKKTMLRGGALGFFLALPAVVFAVPVYDTFGAFPDADWSGSGIPNDPVAVSTQIVDGDVTITLAMSATARYSNPALTDDGAGTYFAQAGSNYGGSGESSSEGALWNWNFFVKVEGSNGATPILTDYQFDVFYDFDPVEDNGLATLGKIDLSAIIGGCNPADLVFPCDPASTVWQDSQNLMFGFLAAPSPVPSITPPAGSFDPNATGEYNFAILARGSGGFPLESVAMDVQIVPLPAAAWLFGSAMFGLTIVARRAKA